LGGDGARHGGCVEPLGDGLRPLDVFGEIDLGPRDLADGLEAPGNLAEGDVHGGLVLLVEAAGLDLAVEDAAEDLGAAGADLGEADRLADLIPRAPGAVLARERADAAGDGADAAGGDADHHLFTRLRRARIDEDAVVMLGGDEPAEELGGVDDVGVHEQAARAPQDGQRAVERDDAAAHEIGVLDDLDGERRREAAEGVADLLMLVADDDDERRDARGRHGRDVPLEERLAANLQQTLGLGGLEAPTATRGEENGQHARPAYSLMSAQARR